MSDLISREAVQRLLTNGECYTVDELVAAIAALPAVQPAHVSILGEHDGVLPDDVYNILTKTEPAAPVTVEEAARVLLNAPFADRDKAANAMLNWGLSPFTAADSLTAALRALAGEKPNE
jgi:hypothetical protein